MDQQGLNEHQDEMEELFRKLRMAAEKHGKDKQWLRHKLEEELQKECGDQQDEAPADTMADGNLSPTNTEERLRPRRHQRQPAEPARNGGFHGQSL
ncbi:hypothetical protein NDU88_001396 [Pleurodeles waltl]|uniref:Uncharacterized protein n=1 Tax=Pleurodeles waltl TaxID=8319 RepID=A0AAV7PB32_PLEWA|nr:hypothetical protein NDU88_001396 [Pleurodeles waltl]